MKKGFMRLTSTLLACTLMFSVIGVGFATQPASTAVTAAISKTQTDVVSTVKTFDRAAAILLNDHAGETEGNPVHTQNSDVLTHCGGNCPHAPSIVIHGIGQSELYALDENDNRMLDKNGKEITAWPPTVDTDALIGSLAAPLIATLLTQRDCGLSDTGAKLAAKVFAGSANGPDGGKTSNTELVRYPYSVARCTEKEKSFIYSSMSLNYYAQVAGEDHLYYFAYDSFGNNLSITEELYAYIQQVKLETGHDKVNLVPVSLGGTIANSLFEFYPDIYEDLNRVLFIVPALDGSNIIGDVYANNLSLEDEMLYRDLLPSFMDGYLGYLINILLRLLPKDVLHAVLDKAVNSLMDTVLVNCTVMWSLVPQAYYAEAAGNLLSGPEHAEIRRQTDLYYRAQQNAHANILKLIENGVSVFDICDYNQSLYAIAGSWDECNSDGVIHLASTSMGATSGLVDTPLAADYVQQQCLEHNHISPDRIVDASTGLLPDHTFYFRNQHHEGTGRNDVIIKLATELLLNNDFTDVYTMPERFPQFNVGREARGFTGDVAKAKTIDQSALTPQDAAELQAAIEQADAMLNNTVVVYEEYTAARERLFAIMVKIGERNAPEDKSKEELLTKICKFLSDTLYRYWGGRGFSDWRV